MKELEVSITMVPGTCDTMVIEELKAYSEEVAALYNEDVVITADNIKQAKEDLASLRKLDKSLKEERIAKHNEYEKPYDEWFTKFKEATDPITSLIGKMAAKVKAYEDEEESKRISTIDAEILKDAEDTRRGLAETVTSNPALKALVFKQNYYNKSASRIKCTEEWRGNLLAIHRDLEVIEKSEDSDQLMIAYLNCGNLAMAMQEIADNKKRIAVINQQKAAQEERDRIKATTSIADFVDITPQTFELKLPNEEVVDPQEKTMVFSIRRFEGELYKIKALYKFAMSIGIKVTDPRKEK